MGRRPNGAVAMTTAERQQTRRARLRASLPADGQHVDQGLPHTDPRGARHVIRSTHRLRRGGEFLGWR
jgi:hypothetical protein